MQWQYPKMLITPHPGADRGNILQALRKVHEDVSNLHTGGPHDTLNRLLSYLDWANNATRLLTGQIGSKDVDRLVLTRRHQQILSSLSVLSSPATAKLSNGLVNLELSDRVEQLGAAVKALELAIERRQPGTLHVVFDTNMFIEHPALLTEIDFAELTQAWDVVDDWNNAINLVIPMQVIDELDKLKQHSDKLVRWRARDALRVIDELFPRGTRLVARLDQPTVGRTALRFRVVVELLVDPPGHVRLPIADDEIVDRAVSLQGWAGAPVHLFTYDTNQSTRGRVAGLTVHKLVTDPGPRPEPSAPKPKRAERFPKPQQVADAEDPVADEA